MRSRQTMLPMRTTKQPSPPNSGPHERRRDLRSGGAGSVAPQGSVRCSPDGAPLARVLLLWVANGIMRGSNGVRLLVAIVQCFSIGSAIYVLVGHHATVVLSLPAETG